MESDISSLHWTHCNTRYFFSPQALEERMMLISLFPTREFISPNCAVAYYLGPSHIK